MISNSELQTTLDDHQTAFTEISFILEVLSQTIGQVVGQSSASLAISAGKFMAKKMPIYLENPGNARDGVADLIADWLNSKE